MCACEFGVIVVDVPRPSPTAKQKTPLCSLLGAVQLLDMAGVDMSGEPGDDEVASHEAPSSGGVVASWI